MTNKCLFTVHLSSIHIEKFPMRGRKYKPTILRDVAGLLFQVNTLCMIVKEELFVE